MSDLQSLIKSYIPMSEASFLLLVSLLEENHGYGIMRQAADMTDQRVSLGAGTVYTIIYKMENDGIIEAVREVDRRKVYRITPLGRELLREECHRIGQLMHIAEESATRLSAKRI